MSTLEVRVAGGVFNVVRDTGELSPIMNHGPVSAFNDGWAPVCVVSAFAPVHLLVLRHVDGADATWFLDGEMTRIGGAAGQVSEPEQAHLQARALVLFRSILATVLTAAEPRSPGDADDLASLSEGTIRELAALVWDELMAEMTVVDLGNPLSDTVLSRFGVDAGTVRETLAGSVPDAYRQRMQDGVLPCVSPFDGAPVQAELGMILLDSLTGYRFTDPRSQRSFYVTTQDYHDRKTGLFLPDLGLYCVSGYAPALSKLFPVLLVHAALHQRRLVRCLALPSAKRIPVNFVSDYPTLHLGHVVWNELSGLQELVSMLDPAALPLVCVLNAAGGSEPFGPIEALFPEFAGKVIRPLVSWSDAAGYVYDSNLFFMRYKTRHVPLAVGRRIRAGVERDPRLAQDRTLAERLHAEGRACVLLGLRVGNRTLGDQLGFLVGVIEHLVARLGRVSVVIDGSNARLGLDASTSYASFGPPGEEEPTITELRIVMALRRHFHHNRRIEFVSTVGAPLACGLFWIMQCRFFVAPWGAALAKYRWVCNLPGFVVTNRFNLGEPVGDLPIYHAPEFVEAPSPMHFVALEHVADAPGPLGFYANFTVDPAAVTEGIDRMIEETAPAED